jgi:uncharacterized protein YndB with AHSA1/START domain
MALQFESTQVIDRPIEKVFHFFAVDHVRNHPRWDSDIELWLDSDAPIGVGTIIHRRNKRSGTSVEGTMEVLEFEPNRMLSMEIHDGNAIFMNQNRGEMSLIHFETTPVMIGNWTILRLPESASTELPSRGSTLVEGTINGFRSTFVLEPDGKGSHWFKIDSDLSEAAGINAGDTVSMAVEPSKEWPEPEVPADLKQALASDSKANALWVKITPMARWDWIRWIRATNNRETRGRRIEVALSKLRSGDRRPCCFNRNLCTEPEVSKNGVLLEPTAPLK